LKRQRSSPPKLVKGKKYVSHRRTHCLHLVAGEEESISPQIVAEKKPKHVFTTKLAMMHDENVEKISNWRL